MELLQENLNRKWQVITRFGNGTMRMIVIANCIVVQSIDDD